MIKYVYLVFHLGDVVYVGSSKDVEQRIRTHWGHSKLQGKRSSLCDYIRTHPKRNEYSWTIIYCGKDWRRVEESTIRKYKSLPSFLNKSPSAVGNTSTENRTRYWVGKRPDAAIKASIEARTGKSLSEEHKAKLKKANAGRNGQKILCVSTGQVFDSAVIAARAFNTSQQTIMRSTRGIKTRLKEIFKCI